MASDADDRQDRLNEEVANALQHVLGNTCQLITTSISFRWNARGPLAGPISTLIAAQSEEMYRGREALALRILSLGRPAIAAMADEMVVPLVGDPRALPTADRMVVLMREGHRAMRSALLAANDVATEAEDPASQDLIASRLLAHDAHTYELARMVS